MTISFIRNEADIAVNAELTRLRELAAETRLDIELVAANQVATYRRALRETRQALTDAASAIAL